MELAVLKVPRPAPPRSAQDVQAVPAAERVDAGLIPRRRTKWRCAACVAVTFALVLGMSLVVVFGVVIPLQCCSTVAVCDAETVGVDGFRLLLEVHNPTFLTFTLFRALAAASFDPSSTTELPLADSAAVTVARGASAACHLDGSTYLRGGGAGLVMLTCNISREEDVRAAAEAAVRAYTDIVAVPPLHVRYSAGVELMGIRWYAAANVSVNVTELALLSHTAVCTSRAQLPDDSDRARQHPSRGESIVVRRVDLCGCAVPWDGPNCTRAAAVPHIAQMLAHSSNMSVAWVSLSVWNPLALGGIGRHGELTLRLAAESSPESSPLLDLTPWTRGTLAGCTLPSELRVSGHSYVPVELACVLDLPGDVDLPGDAGGVPPPAMRLTAGYAVVGSVFGITLSGASVTPPFEWHLAGESPYAERLRGGQGERELLPVASSDSRCSNRSSLVASLIQTGMHAALENVLP